MGALIAATLHAGMPRSSETEEIAPTPSNKEESHYMTLSEKSKFQKNCRDDPYKESGCHSGSPPPS